MKNKMAKGLIQNVTNLPLLNPEIVTGISLMLLFAALRFSGGWVTLIIAHITFCVPSVFLSILPKLRQINKSLYEAAMDLGCTPLQSFLKVELPAILPGVISGFIMSFTLSLDDFIISHFTTSGFETLPIFIYSMTKKKVKPDMYALSTLIFVAILVLLILSNVISSKSEKNKKK